MNSRKQFMSIAAVVAVGVLIFFQTGFSRGDQDDIVIPLGCTISSWTPEVFSFYGGPDKVMDKLSHFDMKLAERRVFMFMVEGADSAELALFERPADEHGSWKIWHWKGSPQEVSRLREEETTQILATQGNKCVGLETVKIVESRNPRIERTNEPPKTAKLAFGEAIERYPKGSYIRTTVFLLC